MPAACSADHRRSQAQADFWNPGDHGRVATPALSDHRSFPQLADAARRATSSKDIELLVIRFDPFGDPFRQLDRLASQLLSGTRSPMGMAMDVWQADDGYHAVLDLPGVDASSVEITSERNVLTIAAER